jgi:RimJ/RimL family protein N-acetyltransferase
VKRIANLIDAFYQSIEYGFRKLNIGRIVNAVAEENIHSVNLMKRLGLRIERN